MVVSSLGKILKHFQPNYSDYVRISNRYDCYDNNRNPIFPRFTFFLDWVRKPTLTVAPHPNNPKEGETSYFVYKKGDKPQAEVAPTYYLAQWTEAGKDEISKLVLKFGIVTIINRPRNLWKGVIHAGKATKVRADIFIRQTHNWQENHMIPLQKEELFRGPHSLNWYQPLWATKTALLSLNPEDALKKEVDEWKLFQNNPTYLIFNYLKNEVLDEISVGRIGELILFITMPNINGFISIGDFMWKPLGRYEIIIRVTCDETCTDSSLFSLNIKGWNNYEFTSHGHADANFVD